MASRGAATETPIEVWLKKVAEARGSGDHLQAFDLASRGLEEHSGAIALEYQALLALARTGATNRAAARLAALRERGKLARIADRQLAVDFASLEGRLDKDRAAEATDPTRRDFLRSSARAYEAAFRRKRDYFPAINAASMWFLAGNPRRSAAMAREALRLAGKKSDDYWAIATTGEALVLLGEAGAAVAALRRAASLRTATYDKIAATRKQMRLLSRKLGLGDTLIEALGEPNVVCFLRDRSAGAAALDGRKTSGAALAAALARTLPNAKGAIAYATLLEPLDIRIAEELRKRRVELNFVLPAGIATCRSAVAASWRKRYRRCIRRAHSVSVVTEAGDADEPTSLSLAVEQKMGLALLRAEALDSEARTVILQSSEGSPIFVSGRLVARKVGRAGAAPADPPRPARVKRALVFGDVKGFSTLAEHDMAAFLDHVIGGFGDALEPFAAAVEYAETAGDGIYLVVSGVTAAARCCLALQEKMRPERLKRVGLPTVQGLRVSAHVGPVSRGYDGVTKRNKFFGTEIIRTARIEPVTEVGAIYVTEQFAATLYCEAGGEFRCEYVGVQPMAKGYGACRMYSLRRSQPGG